MEELGLGRYAAAFADNDVDLRALRHLTEQDLKDLGVSLGHRRIMLAAIAEAPQPAAASPVAPAREKVADGREPEADRRLLSVLFCDMVDSTGLSVSLDPEDLREVIRHFQDATAGAITRFGGHVAQFLGDGLLATFGWPLAYEDHAERALRAGLEALQAVTGIETPQGQRLAARVGIASGRVVVGEIAGRGGRDPAAITGETPNLAARLQALAKPQEIVIAESTRRLAGQGFEITALGRKRLKGFKEALAVYRVERARETESRFAAAHGGSLSRFVGRSNELGMLLERWELAKGGSGQAVFLSGEAGIGKSRLVEALTEHISQEPHTLLRLQCSPYHGNSALYPFVQQLQREAGLSPEDEASARAAKLERLIAADGKDVTRLGALYAELLSLDLGDRYGALEGSAQDLRDLTLASLAERPFLAARKAPVLFVVEDAHWIDPSSSEVLETMAGRSAAAPILLLVTHRPDWSLTSAAGLPQVTNLALGRLTRQQITELVESMTGEVVTEAQAAEIAERTDGVPLFVEELSRALMDRREGNGGAPEIPLSLEGPLMARLDRLPADAKRVAEFASVIGREFERRLLAKGLERAGLAPLAGRTLESALRQLLKARLLVEGQSEDSLLFRHALIQDTAYRSLLTRRRRLYHRAIAEALKATRPALVETQPELIARHYSEAELVQPALPLWIKAGERALDHFSNLEAIGHFARALTLLDRLEPGADTEETAFKLRYGLGRALFAAGHLADAMTALGEAVELARKLGPAERFADAALSFDQAQFLAGQVPKQSLVLLQEALGKLSETENNLRCQTLSRLGRAHRMTGEAAQALSLDRQAIAMARRLKDDRALFDALTGSFLNPVVLTKDDFAERGQQVDELVALAQRIPDADYLGRALSLDVWHAAEIGDRERLERALAVYQVFGEERRSLLHQWVARAGQAMCAILFGDFAAAESLSEAALAEGRKTRSESVEGVYGMQMFSIRREEGRLAEVAPVIKRYLEETPSARTWLPGFALIASDLGFTEAAARRLAEFAERGFELPFDGKRSASLSYLAEVAVALGDRVKAERLYELMSVYEHMTVTAGLVTVCYGAASRYLGMLADTLGDRQKAAEHFERALRMNAALGARPWLAHTQAEYARHLLYQGDARSRAEAETLSREAWATADELAMVRLQQRLRHSLR